MMKNNTKDQTWHGTTIIGVMKNDCVTIAGDGQVTLGQTVIKGTAKKVQRLLRNRPFDEN